MRTIISFVCGAAMMLLVGFTHSNAFQARNVVASNNAAVVSLKAQIAALQCPQVIAALGGTCTTLPEGATTTIHWGATSTGVETSFPYDATCSVP